ncbi:MAG: transporter substrate-binding domain-containing protein, partial [Chloroflexota bacterium]
MSIRVRALSVAAGLVLALPALGWGPVSAAHSAQRVSKGSLHLIHPGILTVGSDTTYPPMESRDVHTGKNVGADVDLAKALAHAMGLRGANVVTTNFNTIIPSLQRRNFDVIMSSMNDTPLRRRQIAFVDYMRASEGIVVQKSSSIHGNSYAALCGHSIAVESGTTEFDGVKQANKHCAKKIDVHTYTLDTAAFEAFASGHTVSYSGDLPVCALYVKKHPALRLAGKAFGAGENYGIGVLYR